MFSKSGALRFVFLAFLLSIVSASLAADELFKAPQSYDSGGFWPVSVAVADVNGDGKPDLVVVNQCGADPNCAGISTVGVLLGNGDGTFQAARSYESGGLKASAVAVGDVNGDGKLDLLVAEVCVDCADGTVGVLLGNGDGTFQAARTYKSGGFGAASVAVGDVNGDGKLDLVIANACADSGTCDHGTLGILIGNGDGTFQTAQSYSSGGADTCFVAMGDVNGDGKLDLVVANPGSYTGAGVRVLIGNGDGTFEEVPSYYSGDTPRYIALADVNSDGNLDVLVANECDFRKCRRGTVKVLLGNGDGTTFDYGIYDYDSGGIWPFSIAAGDVNGDGRPDLLVTNECLAKQKCDSGIVAVLLGDGGDGIFHPVFQPAQPYLSGGKGAISIALADVNGDGKLDLVVANHIGGVGVLLNNPAARNATITTLVSSPNPSYAGQIITFTASVTSPKGGVVTGTVSFQHRYGNSRETMAVVTLSSGQAIYSTAFAEAGRHYITATYSGDASNADGTSLVLEQRNNMLPVPSRTVVITSGSPSFVGQPVTFTATVTTIYCQIPDGEQVTFYDNKTKTLGSATLAGGVASFTTSSLAAAPHYIRATYGGDGTFARSSEFVRQAVIKYPTTTTLVSSRNPSAYGQPVTFTATVTWAGPGLPSGKVTFKDGATGIATATLSGGVATLTRSKLAVGMHPITAEYLGDAASAKSTSSVLDQVVQ